MVDADGLFLFRCALPGALRQRFFALADELVAFFIRHGQDGLGALGQLFVDERIGLAQLVLKLALPQHIPALDSHPESLGHIRRGDYAFDLQQLWIALGATVEPHYARTFAVQMDQGKHLAADRLVAYPKNEVMAPVHAFRCVRQAEAKLADAFVVHDQIAESLLQNERTFPIPTRRSFQKKVRLDYAPVVITTRKRALPLSIRA